MPKDQGHTKTFEELVRIEPETLIFVKSKQTTSYVSRVTLQNTNNTAIAFKFKTNAPSRYSVKPVLGHIEKNGSVEVFVRCEEDLDRQDRFMVQVVPLANDDEIVDAEFWKVQGRSDMQSKLMECKIRGTDHDETPAESGLRQRKGPSTNHSTPSKGPLSTAAVKKQVKKGTGLKDLFLVLLLVGCISLIVARLYGWQLVGEWAEETWLDVRRHGEEALLFVQKKVAELQQ